MKVGKDELPDGIFVANVQINHAAGVDRLNGQLAQLPRFSIPWYERCEDSLEKGLEVEPTIHWDLLGNHLTMILYPGEFEHGNAYLQVDAIPLKAGGYDHKAAVDLAEIKNQPGLYGIDLMVGSKHLLVISILTEEPEEDNSSKADDVEGDELPEYDAEGTYQGTEPREPNEPDDGA